MTLKAWSYAVHGFILAASLFAAEASAQPFGITFAGAPSTIACTNTSFALGPGLTYSWTLPSAGTPVLVVGTAGATTIQNGTTTFPSATGTGALNGGPIFASTPFPYKVTYVFTPQTTGAKTSSLSFLCASATGSNFRIDNSIGGAVAAIPALSELGLLALIALLACASFATFLKRARQT